MASPEARYRPAPAASHASPRGTARTPLAGLLAVLSLMAGGCAAPSDTPTGPSAADRVALEEVRRELASARWDYETGLELIGRGESTLGTDVLEAATTRLRAAAARCAELPHCDPATIEASRTTIARWRPPTRGGRSDSSAPPPPPPSRDRNPALFPPAGEGDELLAQIVRNDHVLAAINEWLTWRREDFADARRRYRFLRESMAPVYEEAGLPEPLLFAQMATESAGKVHAYSRSGAVGPLQFMRVTALRYGLRTIDGFDTRLDPEAATRANVAYLEQHLELFDGDLALVMAAYNGGEGRLRRLLRRHPDASFWDEEVYYALPRETRRHVPRVFAAALLFLHPRTYGLEPPDLERTVGRLTLREPTALGEVAVCLGDHAEPNGWFRTLRNLNPDVDPDERLPAGSEIFLPSEVVAVYARACGQDTPLRRRARALHDAEYPERPPVEPYVVRAGDTLTEIVERFPCTSLRRLAETNDVAPPDYLIHPGQRLVVPRCP